MRIECRCCVIVLELPKCRSKQLDLMYVLWLHVDNDDVVALLLEWFLTLCLLDRMTGVPTWRE